MDYVSSVFGHIGDVTVRTGDTFTDRLNCQYTTFLLLVFAILITTKNYVGDPISCWVPAHFTDSHRDYANKVCWVTNTYYVPFTEEIPEKGVPKENEIGYYQWVGLILIAQAVLFYIPRIFWFLLNKKSGIAVSTITDAACECQRKTDPEGRDKTIKYMIKHMSRYLTEITRKHKMSSYCKWLWYHLYGNYLITLYLIVKVLYISNVIGQLFMLNVFLETDYSAYGFHVIRRIIDGYDWRSPGRFPRITLCDFEIRMLGEVNRYTVQCVLPVNLFNEKIYIFLWFWFVAVACVTATSFVFWLLRFISKSNQIRYIKTRLHAMRRLGEEDKRHVKEFVRDFLRPDGVFVIRLVARNSSDIIAAELITGLFDEYKGKRRFIRGETDSLEDNI